MWLFEGFSFFLMFSSSLYVAHSEKTYYRAAVVEHVRFGNFSDSPQKILEINLKTYETATRGAAEHGADIIVFPEYGLHSHNKENRQWLKNFAEDIPDPKKVFTNPCSQTDIFENRPILKTLSCLAYQNKIYLVANMADTKQCSNRGSCDASQIESCAENYVYCPEDETYFHNTNVVFDRQGTLIARYYKQHLFFEFDMNPPLKPEDIFFETDFGYFTSFVCFDLVFKEPVEAVKKFGVVNVAYPTYWYDFAPFIYLATAYQQAWAIAHKVNLLAANVHNPVTGTVGSGIYSAEKGALVHTNNPDGRSKLLISNVPRLIDNSDESFQNKDVKKFYIDNGSLIDIKSEEQFDQVKCLSRLEDAANFPDAKYNCFQMDNKFYTFVKLKEQEGNIKKCMNDFCCNLSYRATSSLDEDYFLAVFAGDYIALNSFSYGMETCFLSRCDSTDDDESCTNYVTKSRTVFQHVILEGNFTTTHVYPLTINSDVRLTDKKQWIFDGESKITYHNLNKMSSLLFIGLNGRHYERDEVYPQYHSLFNT